MMVGQATAFAPNYGKAMIAAARVFNLLDRCFTQAHIHAHPITVPIIFIIIIISFIIIIIINLKCNRKPKIDSAAGSGLRLNEVRL